MDGFISYDKNILLYYLFLLKRKNNTHTHTRRERKREREYVSFIWIIHLVFQL